MNKSKKHILSIFLFLPVSFVFAQINPAPAGTADNLLSGLRGNGMLFTPNKGQMVDMEGNPVPHVLFKIEAQGVNTFVTTKGLSYIFLKSEDEEHETKNGEEYSKDDEYKRTEWERVDVELLGADIRGENSIKEGESSYFNQYFMAHCPEGILNVRDYEKITIKAIYPGIDWVLYNSTQKGFKYDFVIHPGANPSVIQLLYSSKKKINITEHGSIQIKTKYGYLTENAPQSFLNSRLIDSKFKHIASEKNNKGGYNTTIGFELKTFDSKFGTIVIDPQLNWATFYGGTGVDGVYSLATDNSGNVFAVGYNGSADFPVLNAGTYYQGVLTGLNNVFILKFSNTGVLLWATHYGGTGIDGGHGIATDNAGNLYVTGKTSSTNFPVLNAGTFFQGANAGGSDAFVLKFGNGGTRLWATYYGGSGFDVGYSIATDNAGSVLLTGTTSSTNFPVLNAGTFFQGAIAGGGSDAFVVKFNTTATRLWATYYGGSGADGSYCIAADVSGNIFVTGQTNSANFPIQNSGTFFQGAYAGQGGQDSFIGVGDAFILKFDNAGTRLWATYYGGVDNDFGYSLAIDNVGDLYVAGYTGSANFPVQNAGTFFQGTIAGAVDAFILKFTNTGSRLWATYYGGTATDRMMSYDNLAIDACNNVYISFEVASTAMFTQPSCDGGYFDNTFNGSRDIFIARFSSTGNLLWATYLGGDGQEFRSPIALDSTGNLFVSGEWTMVSSNSSYPLTNPGAGAYYDGTFSGGGADDAFMVKLIPQLPTITPTQTNSTACTPCNGRATVTLSNSCSSYNYTWSNGSNTSNVSSNTNTIAGLCPGNYMVTVTSNCNQIKTTSFVIAGTVCGSLTLNVNSATICSGAVPCPTLTTNAASGTQPYTYSWNTGATTQNISPCPVSTTTYTVKVTDSGGVTATSTAVVTVNPAVTVAATSTNIACNGTSTGSVTATPGGGTPGFTYTWSNGGTTSQITNLTSQIYIVTVTDSKGCTSTSAAAITSPPPLTGQFTKGTANCPTCGCKEWIMVTGVNGTPPYIYQWPDGYDKRYKNSLCPGAYNVIVTDGNGCKTTVKVNAP